MDRAKRGLLLGGATGFGFGPALLQTNVVVSMRESKRSRQIFLSALLHDAVVAKMNGCGALVE